MATNIRAVYENNGVLVINIPMEEAAKTNIKKGDTFCIENDGNKLVLSPVGKVSV